MDGPQTALDALLAALNAHELDTIAALAPGDDRFRESHRRMLTAFPDAHADAEWTVVDSHKAVAWAHITGTHRGEWRGIPPTGRAIDVRGVIALEVDPAGRVIDFWLVNDWLSIATQLGATLTLPSA
jgi:predicted ester cyclase